MWRISNQFLIFKSTLLFHSYKKLNHSGSGIKDILSGISGVETAPLPTSREEVIWLPLTWNRRVDGTEERTQLVVMVALSLSGASPFCYKWQPCPGWCDSVGWVSSCKTKGHWWFQVRAHAWVVGSVPGQGSCGGGGRQIDVSHIDASLPLFFPPFPSKKKMTTSRPLFCTLPGRILSVTFWKLLPKLPCDMWANQYFFFYFLGIPRVWRTTVMTATFMKLWTVGLRVTDF